MKKMRLSPVAFSDVAEIVKANLSGWYLLLALLFLSLLISNCSKKDQLELESNFPVQGCEVNATAVTVVCGFGAFEDTWLQLENGKYLQPWANATSVQNLIPGQKYRVGYAVMVPDNRYKDLVICKAALPVSETIKLTCLQSISDTGN
jgi:hypothetical protein